MFVFFISFVYCFFVCEAFFDEVWLFLDGVAWFVYIEHVGHVLFDLLCFVVLCFFLCFVAYCFVVLLCFVLLCFVLFCAVFVCYFRFASSFHQWCFLARCVLFLRPGSLRLCFFWVHRALRKTMALGIALRCF